jgi:hypothetical protein
MYVDMHNLDNYILIYPLNPWLLNLITAIGCFEVLVFAGADDETD